MNYQVSAEGYIRLGSVVRFDNNAGQLGMSSKFMYDALTSFKNGEFADISNISVPADCGDFARVGMLIICRPELEFYLSMMKTYNLEWYNIIENWDKLMNEFFYSFELSHRQLTCLLQEVMNTPQPGKIFQSDYNKIFNKNKDVSDKFLDDMFKLLDEPSNQKNDPPSIEPHVSLKFENQYPSGTEQPVFEESKVENEYPNIPKSSADLFITVDDDYISDDDKISGNDMLYEDDPKPANPALQNLVPTQNPEPTTQIMDDFLMQSTDVYSVKRTHIPDHMSPYVKKTTTRLDNPLISNQECNEIANQILENHGVLIEMEIPAQVAVMLIPRLIKKFNENVNITWTSGHIWQEIYYHHGVEYDIPKNNASGYLHVNEPMNFSSMESSEVAMKLANKEHQEMEEIMQLINKSEGLTFE